VSVKLTFDLSLVIGESAIDCLSYEVLFPGNRYASIVGGLNPDQPTFIRKSSALRTLTLMGALRRNYPALFSPALPDSQA
jgi:hypothetical protein